LSALSGASESPPWRRVAAGPPFHLATSSTATGPSVPVHHAPKAPHKSFGELAASILATVPLNGSRLLAWQPAAALLLPLVGLGLLLRRVLAVVGLTLLLVGAPLARDVDLLLANETLLLFDGGLAG
jgi:hypothetical protein